jgi:hypothetical protein
MGKSIRWSKNLAYAIGLITTDGCLSNDSRHLTLVSKDIEQITTFAKILKLKNKISFHKSTYNPQGVYYHIQFGNVILYRFLIDIGLTSNKSLTLGVLKIPTKYFADFLRGHLDGDGNISIVSHKQSLHPQLRLKFCSASLKHIEWLKESISKFYMIKGGHITNGNNKVFHLTYGKSDSIQLLEFIYYVGVKYFLSRKYNYYIDKMGEW